MKPPASVTELLVNLRDGDREAFDELFPMVYDALYDLAKRQRGHWHRDYTVNTTALVHEAYLKLIDQTSIDYESRAHFLAVAGRAMRHILLDYAKRRRAQKRGGDVQKLSFDEVHGIFDGALQLSDERAEILVALDEALQRLAQKDQRLSQVVECRFFGEMTIDETAAVLGISPATVKRSWRSARIWLCREIADNYK